MCSDVCSEVLRALLSEVHIFLEMLLVDCNKEQPQNCHVF